MGKIIVVIIAAIVIIGGAVALTHKSNNKTSTTGSTTNSSMSNMTNSSSSSTNQTAVATDKVSIKDFSFTPAKITVKKGTSVTWTNNDSAAHTVTVDSGTGPNSDDLEMGQSYSFTFNTTGTFTYHCKIHPSMHGTVVVE